MEKQVTLLDLRKDSSVPHDATGPQGTLLSFPEDVEKNSASSSPETQGQCLSLTKTHTLRNKTLRVPT